MITGRKTVKNLVLVISCIVGYKQLTTYYDTDSVQVYRDCWTAYVYFTIGCSIVHAPSGGGASVSAILWRITNHDLAWRHKIYKEDSIGRKRLDKELSNDRRPPVLPTSMSWFFLKNLAAPQKRASGIVNNLFFLEKKSIFWKKSYVWHAGMHLRIANLVGLVLLTYHTQYYIIHRNVIL